MTTHTVKKQIHIQSSAHKVFEALTSSQAIPCYYPLTEVISDWIVGREILYKGELDGQPFTDYGVIKELDKPLRYSYSYWSDNHGTERTPENYLKITYSLVESDGGTLLAVEQSNIHSRDMAIMMDSLVWDDLLARLRNYVEAH